MLNFIRGPSTFQTDHEHSYPEHFTLTPFRPVLCEIQSLKVDTIRRLAQASKAAWEKPLPDQMPSPDLGSFGWKLVRLGRISKEKLKG